MPLADASHLIAQCRQQTAALLDEQPVWIGVEQIAEALLRNRFLSPSFVKNILDTEFRQLSL